MSAPPAPPDAFERVLDARLVASVAAAGILSLCGVVVETSMNIAFPALMAEFAVTTATVQWITTGYLLVLAAIIPLSAYLKRRFRLKSLFTAALVLFLAGTLACIFAPSFPVLLAGRLVEGVGTGLTLPLMYNIVIDQAPREKMGLMMGVATLVTAIGPAAGPVLGGFIVDTWGWRAIFMALVPLLAVSLVMGVATMRQPYPTRRVSFSVPQFATLAASFACLLFAANAASTAGWLSARTLCLLAAFAVLLALFCLLALRSDEPLIDVRMFRITGFSLSVAYVVLLQATALATSYLIPNYAQLSFGYGALAAGCLMLPGCVTGALLAPFGGRLLDALGAKRPIVFGAFSQLAALSLLAALSTRVPVIWLAVFNIFISISQGFSMSNSITNGLSFLPLERTADGNAAMNTLQQLGGALGTAVATSIVSAAQSGAADMAAATTTGVATAFHVFLLVSIAALLLTCLKFLPKHVS